jgi:hypothetical protein
LASAPLLAGALYWAVYGIAVAAAVPVALALLFGVVQTARWFVRSVRQTSTSGGDANGSEQGAAKGS